jgi:hypothetical protein
MDRKAGGVAEANAMRVADARSDAPRNPLPTTTA